MYNGWALHQGWKKLMLNAERPIGIFDSGLGGLSVLRTALRMLPEERFLYYGDIANAPYGTKTEEQVYAYARAVTGRLMDQGIKALVIACNTATAAAAAQLRAEFPDFIIVGMEPALKLAHDQCPEGRILVLATPVGMQAGGRNFGVAAGSGEIDLTVRAWYDADLDKLTGKVTTLAGELAYQAGVIPEMQERDVFPATHNDPSLCPLAERAAARAGLTVETPPEPFRWSDDFGHYARHCPAFFCGIGGGTDAAGLHTPDYQWNDAVTEAALRFFSALLIS